MSEFGAVYVAAAVDSLYGMCAGDAKGLVRGGRDTEWEGEGKARCGKGSSKVWQGSVLMWQGLVGK